MPSSSWLPTLAPTPGVLGIEMQVLLIGGLVLVILVLVVVRQSQKKKQGGAPK